MTEKCQRTHADPGHHFRAGNTEPGPSFIYQKHALFLQEIRCTLTRM